MGLYACAEKACSCTFWGVHFGSFPCSRGLFIKWLLYLLFSIVATVTVTVRGNDLRFNHWSFGIDLGIQAAARG